MIDLMTLTDGQLLKEFIEKNDQGAFAIVVERHTRMVFSICRSILGSDAEDAAQATFIVLARKASTIHSKLSAGPWLHRVAHRMALIAYRSKKARTERERKVAEMTDTITTDESGDNEVLALVTRELDAMPEKYRNPLILFHLENASLESAARLLACPLQTVGTRLARGREMLRKRLLRHGVAVSGAAIGILLSTDAGAATIPPGFVSATTRAAVLCAAGKTAALTGGVSAKVYAVVESTLKAMFYAQVRLAAIIVASVGLLSATGVATYKTATAHPAAPFAGWEHKMKITFSGYNRTQPLTNFPALVILDVNSADFAYNQFASTKGYDLRFSDATQTTELNYEVESWNTNGRSYAWVQVPELRTSSDCVWAYWGNPAAAQQQPYTTNGATWTEGFKGVWHLNEKSGVVINDSASNKYSAVKGVGATLGVAGKMDGGNSFDGKTSGHCVIGTLGIGTTNVTIECWVNLADTSKRGSFVMLNGRNPNGGYGIGVGSGDWNHKGNHLIVLYEDVSWNDSGIAIGTGWHYVAFRLDSSSYGQAYLDGFPRFRTLNKAQPPDGNTYFGGYWDLSRSLTGDLDEIRISGVARSPDWLLASYMTEASNSVFSSYEIQ